MVYILFSYNMQKPVGKTRSNIDIGDQTLNVIRMWTLLM
jgi:hypothetical protein